jgi:hypothetical protein
MFIVYTNFVRAIYDFHHLNCDLILNFLLMGFKKWI